MLSRLRLGNILRVWGWALAVATLMPFAARAADVFYSVPVLDLKFTQGKLPGDDAATSRQVPWGFYPSFSPYAVLDGEGEAYVRTINGIPSAYRAAQANLVVRSCGPAQSHRHVVLAQTRFQRHGEARFCA